MFVPSLVVIKVSKQHVFGDGLGQGSHGLVVLWDHLGGKKKKPVISIPSLMDAGGHMKQTSANT